MKIEKILALVAIAAGLVLTAGDARAEAPSASASSWSDPYDRTYWARPHNTYQPDHFDHFDSPLRLGVRAVEVDIHEFKDVDGVRQFPVKHYAWDPDTWNNCREGRGGYLRDCLTDIRTFCDDDPDHLPVTLQIDLKREWIHGWDDAQLDELHEQVAEVLGDRLYRPDDLRSRNGDDSLRAGVAVNGWPSLSELAGKVVVLIMGGPIGDKNDAQEGYVRRYGALANFFVCPNAGSPENFAADGNADDFDEHDTNKWVVCGNVRSPQRWKDIAEMAAENRQLMNLWSGDEQEYDEFHKMYLAIGWGATMISRANEDTFDGKLPLNGRRRSVPVEFRIADANGEECATIRDASYSDGSEVIEASCTSATSQTWIYSDETELRAKDDDAYCLDIEGGDARHLWSCDGGDGEKWQLQPDGSWVGMNGRCMGVPYGSTDCDGESAQRLYLSW